MLSHSVVSDSVTPWSLARRAPLSMGFSRQEDWSGLPCPPPWYFPDAGIEPTPFTFPALVGGFFTTSANWESPAGTYCWPNTDESFGVRGQGGEIHSWGGCPAEAAACGAEQSMGEQETGPKDSGPRSDSLL